MRPKSVDVELKRLDMAPYYVDSVHNGSWNLFLCTAWLRKLGNHPGPLQPRIRLQIRSRRFYGALRVEILDTRSPSALRIRYAGPPKGKYSHLPVSTHSYLNLERLIGRKFRRGQAYYIKVSDIEEPNK